MLKILRKIRDFLVSIFIPIKYKRYHEVKYWKEKVNKEKILSNDHYKMFYTDFINLSEVSFKDKVILDVGCGPRGSLEWADMARRRVGLDPLANKYLKLGASKHSMEYCNSSAESMPFDDCTFDYVFSYNSLDHVENSLDHVENVNLVLSEIHRVLKQNGSFYLMVEVNHEPTSCEPHFISPKNIVDYLSPKFDILETKLYKPIDGGLWNSIENNGVIQDPINSSEEGWFFGKYYKG
jgi:ubiquinone/menaquinone biosynthesis C-methylase UbiE